MVIECPNCREPTDDPLLEGFCRKCVLWIDVEARQLVFALNRLPGITTIESCYGHGSDPFRIWFEVSLYEKAGLEAIKRAIAHEEWPQGERWRVYHTKMAYFSWILESGEAGPGVYGQSRLLCRHLEESSCSGTS